MLGDDDLHPRDDGVQVLDLRSLLGVSGLHGLEVVGDDSILRHPVVQVFGELFNPPDDV